MKRYLSKRQAAYRQYLRTEHWTALRAAAVERDGGKCVKCGSTRRLQVHHKQYRVWWEDGVLDDVESLCRKCHQRVHGIRTKTPVFFFPCRDDEQFNAFVHRIHFLNKKVFDGRGLRERDMAFLDRALRLYPPSETDSAMEFQVCQVYRRELEFGATGNALDEIWPGGAGV